MVKDSLNAINVVFDADRSLPDAGVLVTATAACRLGIEALVNECVDPGRRLRAASQGDVVGLRDVVGADSIDDCDVLRSGRTRRVLGHRGVAPSTLGTLLRATSFGHRAAARRDPLPSTRAAERARGRLVPPDLRAVLDAPSTIDVIASFCSAR
jgi:hypothetical protein